MFLHKSLTAWSLLFQRPYWGSRCFPLRCLIRNESLSRNSYRPTARLLPPSAPPMTRTTPCYARFRVSPQDLSFPIGSILSCFFSIYGKLHPPFCSATALSMLPPSETLPVYGSKCLGPLTPSRDRTSFFFVLHLPRTVWHAAIGSVITCVCFSPPRTHPLFLTRLLPSLTELPGGRPDPNHFLFSFILITPFFFLKLPAPSFSLLFLQDVSVFFFFFFHEDTPSVSLSSQVYRVDGCVPRLLTLGVSTFYPFIVGHPPAPGTPAGFLSLSSIILHWLESPTECDRDHLDPDGRNQLNLARA